MILKNDDIDMADNMYTTSSAPARLQVGVVGLGRIGSQHALNALHYVPRVRLVCACTPMDKELDWAYEHLAPYGVRIYKSLDDMLEDADLQALLIASTTKVHYEQVVAGIHNGLHVLCEKPLAMTLEQCYKIQELASKSPNAHLRVMTAFCRRFDASYQNAIEAIKTGRIGTPTVVRCENRDKYDRSEAMLRYLMANPGIFIDSGVHDIDLTLSFLGPDVRPKSCHAIGTTALHMELQQIGDVDNGIGTVEWYPLKDGGTAPVSSYYLSRIMQHGFDNATEIIGTEGTLKVNLHPRRDLITVANKDGLTNDVMPDFYERYQKAFVTELEAFANCVLDQQPLPYELSTTIKGMKIAQALQESLQTGKKIYWDESGDRMDEAKPIPN